MDGSSDPPAVRERRNAGVPRRAGVDLPADSLQIAGARVPDVEGDRVVQAASNTGMAFSRSEASLAAISSDSNLEEAGKPTLGLATEIHDAVACRCAAPGWSLRAKERLVGPSVHPEENVSELGLEGEVELRPWHERHGAELEQGRRRIVVVLAAARALPRRP